MMQGSGWAEEAPGSPGPERGAAADQPQQGQPVVSAWVIVGFATEDPTGETEDGKGD